MAEKVLLRRRSALAGAGCLAIWPAAWGQGSVEFLVLTMAAKNLPVSALATCADLEASAKAMASAAKRAKDQPLVVADEVLKKVVTIQAGLKKARADAQNALDNAKLDEAFFYVNTGLSLAFIGLGLALTGPVAVGVLAGASVITGATSFAVQATYRKGADHLSFVTGYAKGRALMFAETGAKGFAKSSVQSAGFFVAAVEYRDALNNQAHAKTLLIRSIQELAALDKEIAALGQDKKAWAALYETMFANAATALSEFIKAHKGSDCRLPMNAAKGPMIVKP